MKKFIYLLILLYSSNLLALVDNVNICTFGENETTDYFLSKISSKSKYTKVDKTLAFENHRSLISNCQANKKCDIVLVTNQFMDQLMVSDMNEVTMANLEKKNCLNKCPSLFGASNVFFLGESTILDNKAKDFSAEELKQVLEKLGYNEEVANKYITNNKSLYLKSLRKRFYSLFSESKYLFGIGGPNKNFEQLKLSIDKYFGKEIDLNRILVSSALNITSDPKIVNMSLIGSKSGCLKLDASSTFKENICNSHNKDVTVANDLYQQVLEKTIPNHEDYYSFVLDHYTKCVVEENDCDAHKSFFQNTLNASSVARDIYGEFSYFSTSPLLKKDFANVINNLFNTNLMKSKEDLKQWYHSVREHVAKFPVQNSLTKVVVCSKLKDKEKTQIESIKSEVFLKKSDYRNLLKSKSGRKTLRCINHSYLSQKDFKEAVDEAFESDQFTGAEQFEIMGLYYEFFPAITDQDSFINFLVETPLGADGLIEKIASFHSLGNSNDLNLSQNAEFIPLLVQDWNDKEKEKENEMRESHPFWPSKKRKVMSTPTSYDLSDIQDFLEKNDIKRTDQQILSALSEYKKLVQAPVVSKSFEPIGRDIFRKILSEKSEISNSDVKKICMLSNIESKSKLSFFSGEYKLDNAFNSRNGVRAIKCLSPKHFKTEKLQVALNDNFDKIENYEDIYYLGNLVLGLNPNNNLKQKIIKKLKTVLSASRNQNLRTQIWESFATHKVDIDEDTISKMLTVKMTQDELDFICKRYRDDQIPKFLLPMEKALMLSSRGKELIQCLELEDDYAKIFTKSELIKFYRDSEQESLFINIFISKMKTVSSAKELAGYLVDLKKISLGGKDYDFPQIDLAQVKPDGYENILLLLAAKNFDFISYTVPREQIIDILLYEDYFENIIINEEEYESIQPLIENYSEKDKERIKNKYHKLKNKN